MTSVPFLAPTLLVVAVPRPPSRGLRPSSLIGERITFRRRSPASAVEGIETWRR